MCRVVFLLSLCPPSPLFLRRCVANSSLRSSSYRFCPARADSCRDCRRALTSSFSTPLCLRGSRVQLLASRSALSAQSVPHHFFFSSSGTLHCFVSSRARAISPRQPQLTRHETYSLHLPAAAIRRDGVRRNSRHDRRRHSVGEGGRRDPPTASLHPSATRFLFLLWWRGGGARDCCCGSPAGCACLCKPCGRLSLPHPRHRQQRLPPLPLGIADTRPGRGGAWDS